MDSAQQNGAYFSWSECGLGLDWDWTDIDSPRQSWSQSQKFLQGLDHLVSGPAKMAPDWTKLNFPNTTMKENREWANDLGGSEAVSKGLKMYCQAVSNPQVAVEFNFVGFHREASYVFQP